MAVKVSIVMPSLNVAPYIRECIESAINQTLKDIEIICVDAGSTDGTLEILQEYVQKDSRVRLICSDVKSYGHQMNLGFDAALGEYLGILETDDYIIPEMYEELYSIAKTNKLDFVKSDHKIFVGDIENREYTYCAICEDEDYGRIINPREYQKIFFAKKENWSGIYRMDFLRENNIRHNETPGASFQDNGFWFQNFVYANRTWFVNKAYYMLRRDNPNSSVLSKGKVFCIFDEYKFIEDKLRKDEDIEKQFIAIFHKRKKDSYLFHYNRIAEEYKLDFIKHMSADFAKAYQEGEIDESLFGEDEFAKLRMIIEKPELYYLLHADIDRRLLTIEEENILLQYEIEGIQEELDGIKNGVSFRVSRMITLPVRAFCWAKEMVQERGFVETMKIFLIRVRILKGKE